MKVRVGPWVRPSQCESFGKWIHETWVLQKGWHGHDCMVIELWSRWFGFEFVEQELIED